MASEKPIFPSDLITAIRDDPSINGAHFARVKRHIEAAPRVDAVEVVRCKDCKHYAEDELWCSSNCCVGDSHANWYPHDFCSYGERREEE